MHNIILSGVSYAWPGNDRLFENVSFSLSRGIHAIAGANGTGKTTLLRLIAGELKPSTGSIHCGITPRLVNSSEYPVSYKSSGEHQMQMLEVALAHGSGIILLDEPERHLDGENRKRLLLRLRNFGGVVIFATHDAELLALATGILHLERREITLYSMCFSAYEKAIESERAKRLYAQQRAENKVESALTAAERNLVRQLQRERTAASKGPDAGIPRIARGLMKRNAEKTRGKIIRRARDKITESREELRRLRAANARQTEFSFMRDDATKYVSRLAVTDLNFGVDAQHLLWPQNLSFSARAGERLRIAGRNGSGKSLLFSAVCGNNPVPQHGHIERRCQRFFLLDQNCTAIATTTSLLELARQNFSQRSDGEIRRLLGAYGFWGQAVFRSFDSLSTGERVRLLVFLLSKADNPPDLLIADEAETGLDRESCALLARFFSQYRGLLLFATHSDEFALQVRPTGSMELIRQQRFSAAR